MTEKHGKPARGAELSFDHQASDFDRRAGLPAAAAEAIGREVAALSPASRPRGPWLEIGVGTAELGWPLAAAVAPRPVIGLDFSWAMLREARRKERLSGPLTLVQADANRPWPLASGSAVGIFCSRAAHLLDRALFMAETRRVLAPGGILVFGEVQRDPGSVRAVLQREMRRVLGEQGGSRDSRRAHAEICDAFVAAGAERLPRCRAARWPVEERPIDSLAAWRAKGGLAGRARESADMELVLAAVEAKARELFGDLTRSVQAEETYELQAVCWPDRDEGVL